jgi:hypothetical protein
LASSTWKNTERKIAALVGGRRIPVSGRARGDSADIEHDTLSIEVKHRRHLPNWLLDAIDQAEKSVRGEQLPVAILHQKGQKFEDSLMVLRLADFLAWFGQKP